MSDLKFKAAASFHDFLLIRSLLTLVHHLLLCVLVIRPKRVIKLVPEYLLKKRKAYQAIKATQAKLALLDKRKVSDREGSRGQMYLDSAVGLTARVHVCACRHVKANR